MVGLNNHAIDVCDLAINVGPAYASLPRDPAEEEALPNSYHHLKQEPVPAYLAQCSVNSAKH
jgi:hypothetical protein